MAEQTTTDTPNTATRRVLDAQCREVPGRDRTLRFIASTEEVARDGDIVRVAGWETERFMSNPVFLWSHSYDEAPIGRVVRVKKVARPKDGTGPRLEIDVEFAGLEQLHENAERAYLLYRDGFLRAVSVGFMPLEFQDISEDQRTKLGLGSYGRVIKRAELLEVSAVAVPADSGAVIIDDEEDRAVCKEALLSVRSFAPEAEQARFDALAASLDGEPEPLPPIVGTASNDHSGIVWTTTGITNLPDIATSGYVQTLSDSDAILTELRAIRERVERLLAERDIPQAPVPPTPADAPATPPEPPTTPTPAAPTTDFYGIYDRAISRNIRKVQNQ